MENAVIQNRKDQLTQLEAQRPTMSLKEFEKELIKLMTGIYRVDFKFTETFAPDKNYQFGAQKLTAGIEYVFVLEETEDMVSLQHLLYAGRGGIIKHWRQDWHYEETELFTYFRHDEWHKKTISSQQAKGTWTQKVYQVEDCLRYQGYGTWIHVDGRHFWESTADAPLPRRELNVRNDYQVLKRFSHIELFNDGSWVLEQDNQKLIRDEEGKDRLLVMEKGLETFTPSDYSDDRAKAWWEEHQAFWADVRAAWDRVVRENDKVKVKVEEGEDYIYGLLFDLSDRFAGDNYRQNEARQAIDEVFSSRVLNNNH